VATPYPHGLTDSKIGYRLGVGNQHPNRLGWLKLDTSERWLPEAQGFPEIFTSLPVSVRARRDRRPRASRSKRCS